MSQSVRKATRTHLTETNTGECVFWLCAKFLCQSTAICGCGHLWDRKGSCKNHHLEICSFCFFVPGRPALTGSFLFHKLALFVLRLGGRESSRGLSWITPGRAHKRIATFRRSGGITHGRNIVGEILLFRELGTSRYMYYVLSGSSASRKVEIYSTSVRKSS